MKINLGCGKDYKKGYVNVDNNRNVKADIYCDLEERFPFESNSVDEIVIESVVEHISRDNIFKFFEECWRVCKHGAKIKILTNHYTSMWATQHLDHRCCFGVCSLGVMDVKYEFIGESYNKARFKVNKIRLHFFYPKPVFHKFLAKLPINWLFNFNLTWQMIMERFQVFGFDGISYELEVYKKEKRN